MKSGVWNDWYQGTPSMDLSIIWNARQPEQADRTKRSGLRFAGRLATAVCIALAASIFLTGCLDTEGARLGLMAGVIVGGGGAAYMLTKTHSTAASTAPVTGEGPEKVLQAFAGRLKNRDIDGALAYVATPMRDQFEDLFTRLRDKLPLVADDISAGKAETGLSTEFFCEVNLVREEGEGKITYPVVFVKESSGEWRISGI